MNSHLLKIVVNERVYSQAIFIVIMLYLIKERAYVLILKLFKIEHITNSNNHHNYLIIYMRL